MKRHLKAHAWFWPLIILVAVNLWFFKEVVKSGFKLLLFGSDTLLTGYPAQFFAHKWTEQLGHIPYWNPHVDSGVPFLANFLSTAFYPPARLLVGMEPHLAINLMLMGHVLFGSVMTYLLFRNLNRSRLASLLGSLVLWYGGFMSLRLYAGHNNCIYTLSLSALLFYLWERYIQHRRIGLLLAASSVLALQMTLVYHQYIALTHYVLVPFVLYSFWKQKRAGEKLRYAVGALLLYIILGIGLSTISWLPAYYVWHESVRQVGMHWDYAIFHSLEFKNLLSLLLPNYFGDFVAEPYLADGYVWEAGGYIGLATLPLLFSVDYSKRHHRWMLIGCSVLLLLAMGRSLPWLYRFVVTLFPPQGFFRAPGRFIVCFLMLYSALFTAGIDAVLQNQKQRISRQIALLLSGLLLCLFLLAQPWARAFVSGSDMALQLSNSTIVWSILLTLLVIWLPYMRQRRAWILPTLLVAAITLDLHLANSRYYNVVPPLQAAPLADFNFDNGRVLTSDSHNHFLTRTMLFGFDNIGGVEPMLPARYNEYLAALRGEAPNSNQSVFNADFYLPTMDLVSLRWIITDRESASYASLIPRLNQDGLRVYENPNTLPRAFFIQRLERATRQSVIERMLHQSEWFRTAALSESREAEFSVPPLPPQRRDISPDAYIIDVPATPSTTFLVITDNFYPGWSASADGKPLAIERINGHMLGVELPAGTSQVAFAYYPPGLKLGAYLSGISGAIWGLILVGFAAQKRGGKRLIRRRKSSKK